MPSYLDFDSTKKFRDFILSKTLNNPLEPGPRSFTNNNYTYQKLSSYSNVNPGDVVKNDTTSRDEQNKRNSGINRYKPDEFIIKEQLNNYVLNNGKLKLYPYFSTDIPKYNLISISQSDSSKTESELFKFALNNIKNNVNGPLLSRINQNTVTNINGKNRLLDALNGNTSTALNLVTGKESLVEFNNSITVSKTFSGKALDFTEKITGFNVPVSQIPGDYLSNPLSLNYNTKTKSGNEVVNVLQDIGSLIGVNKRKTPNRNPSDLMVEYMGQGPKQKLFDLLSYSKYAPNYTTSAMSQNTSKVFNFIDNLTQKTKDLFGLEAPDGVSYIGDDRGDSVKYSMSDFNDNIVKGNYYLTLLFDKVSAELYHNSKSYTNRGDIAGELTWVKKQNDTKLNNKSTDLNFRDDSILNKTQELLNSGLSNGTTFKSHISNVIDQTSKVFYDGDVKISKGSAIKYIDKFNKEENGIEYCRVWTKDRPYLNYSNTMRRTSNLRKFDSSILGGQSRNWNLNITPVSNGKNNFDDKSSFSNSTNIDNVNFVAKKYMLSIENLAWKISNRPGYTVNDLPVSERGPNGGRIMWFPPYELKVSDNNSAKWTSNSFLGRPEPIYTYENTDRSGTLGFKLIVDHPSILNLIVQKELEFKTTEESENYIESFFSGCHEIDFYDLIQKYSMLDSNDIDIVKQYLNQKNVTQQQIEESLKKSIPQTNENNSKIEQSPTILDYNLYFDNDTPLKQNKVNLTSDSDYGQLFEPFIKQKDLYTERLKTLLQILGNKNNSNDPDKILIFGSSPNSNDLNSIINTQTGKTETNFNSLQTTFDKLKSDLSNIKQLLQQNKIEKLDITINTSASALGDSNYNEFLGYRRGHSIVKYIITQLQNKNYNVQWFNSIGKNNISELIVKFKDIGYDNEGSLNINFSTTGENVTFENVDCSKNIKANDVKDLEIYSLPSYGCRRGEVKIKYTQKTPQPTPLPVPVIDPTPTPKKIPTNRLLTIISKILGEQYYFKKLEETDPLVFNSLKEKLKYFHPLFHSMTPEGLNGRMTFLQQCLRPGDTIPIKGNNDVTRNTTFGPPPVCILRIGDFYHSKVIIESVNFTYDDNLWDFNPEGIGVQPMIVGVTMGLKFIGGHGLEKPVEQLQNALSSNFFANTEMYDDRAINTSNVNGKNLEQFTKEFLEGLSKKPQNQLKINDDEQNKKEFIDGEYIGTLVNEGTDYYLNYTNIISNLYISYNRYNTSYNDTFKKIYNDYGDILSSLTLNNDFKTKKQYIFTTSNTDLTFNLFGNDDKIDEKINIFKNILINKLNGVSLYELFSFNKILKKEDRIKIDTQLKNYIKNNIIEKFINEFSDNINSKIKGIIGIRNELIKNLDKLNFIMKYEHDVTIENTDVKKINYNSFTKSDFYNKFDNVITDLKSNENIYQNFYPDYDNTTLTDSQFKTILSIILNINDYKYLNLLYYNFSEQKFTGEDVLKMSNKIKDFIEKNKMEVTFKKEIKDIIKKTNTEIKYFLSTNENEIVTNPDEITDVLKLFNKKDKSTTTLNYYKNE